MYRGDLLISREIDNRDNQSDHRLTVDILLKRYFSIKPYFSWVYHLFSKGKLTCVVLEQNIFCKINYKIILGK